MRGLLPAFGCYARRMVREPLVHFLLIGLVLFAAYGVVEKLQGNRSAAPYRIELTADDLRQLQLAFAAQWQRLPSRQEFQNALQAKIREEVLYREALALGLDKDDTIVKRRLAQKMEFLSEDVSSAHEPTAQELSAWYTGHRQEFAIPARASFRHLFFGFDRRGQKAQPDAVRALRDLAGKPEDYPPAAALADRFMLQDYYRERTAEQVARDFGSKFAQALFRQTPGSWQGPIESGYGWHLVWIESLIPERVPAFEEIENDVRSQWLSEQRAEYKRKAYEAMRARYQVVLPRAAGDELGKKPPPPRAIP